MNKKQDHLMMGIIDGITSKLHYLMCKHETDIFTPHKQDVYTLLIRIFRLTYVAISLQEF